MNYLRFLWIRAKQSVRLLRGAGWLWLIAGPLIIMDEPFNGVDLQSSEIIYQLIEHLKQQGHYLLISSHIVETLANTCEQISLLSEGVFSRTYSRDDFPLMQQQLRTSLKRNIQQALDKLKP